MNTESQSPQPCNLSWARFGILFRPGSLWIGGHWSAENRRLCINLLPCFTIWLTLSGGKAPMQGRHLLLVGIEQRNRGQD